MLAVQEHPATVVHQQPDGVGDHRQVLLQGGAQRPLHVPDVGLGHQGDHRRAGVQQRPHLRILVGADTGFAGGAEGDQRRGAQRQFTGPRAGEELRVLGHRPWPATLDETDPELVQQGGHGDLVGDRVGDALPLGTVPQRGVEDVEGIPQR